MSLQTSRAVQYRIVNDNIEFRFVTGFESEVTYHSFHQHFSDDDVIRISKETKPNTYDYNIFPMREDGYSRIQIYEEKSYLLKSDTPSYRIDFFFKSWNERIKLHHDENLALAMNGLQ